ncbi:hypothetical protein DFH08DRAFT_946555 [Mycena albidolilacea]|uniref:Nephrocystin 3-like N-terminal domain-containing protein n=1 Tax=Mycena albidolilacea TaxID=1033008 RepID=A0AAD7F6C2_9AGAR|nr:hypothetical protein DFH08DRAFT_946555 [Mycena albidolilacea]
MSRKKGTKGKIVERAGDAAVLVLKTVVAATSIFPPLQSVAGCALSIITLVQDFRSNTKAWAEFGDHVTAIVVGVIGKLPDNNPVRDDIKESINQLSLTLSRILKEIEEIQNKSTASRFLMSAASPGKIPDMRRHLDEAIKLLELKITINTHTDVATIAAALKDDHTSRMDVAALFAAIKDNNQGATELFERCREIVASTITFTALSYTSNAGWDDTQTCLVGTRQAEIDKVMDWVREKDISGTQQIYFLADVVGSGKTALAHSIAQECSDYKLLASSFFFDRKAGRTSPRDFVFNLARDLASKFPEVSGHISLALQADPTLSLSPPVSLLFEKLVLEPVLRSGVPGPIVVVIDALHEVENSDVESILRWKIPILPGQFRVFVTSRPERSILRSLGPDITPHDLAIHGSANRADMEIYATHKLDEIALEHELGHWPDQQLITTVLNRAEGLFVWIATICDYLFSQVCPDKLLEDLLETAVTRETQLPPEKKMDGLYSTILVAAKQWDNPYFVEGYQRVMGGMVVQKKPLTVDGLQLLHGSARPPPKEILSAIASLITGLTRSNHPVQILHSSFREYIIARAPGAHRILAEQHNAWVALICVTILNEMFSSAKIDGCGYLASSSRTSADSTGVPDVEVGHFTEAQWYAVDFWLVHMTHCDLTVLTPDLKEALRTFLSRHLLSWIEVITSKSKYQSLIPLRNWLETTAQYNLIRDVWHQAAALGEPLVRLLKRLLEDRSRPGEVLLVMKDLKDMGQNSWADDSMAPFPSVFIPGDDEESDDSSLRRRRRRRPRSGI